MLTPRPVVLPAGSRLVTLLKSPPIQTEIVAAITLLKDVKSVPVYIACKITVIY